MWDLTRFLYITTAKVEMTVWHEKIPWKKGTKTNNYFLPIILNPLTPRYPVAVVTTIVIKWPILQDSRCQTSKVGLCEFDIVFSGNLNCELEVAFMVIHTQTTYNIKSH